MKRLLHISLLLLLTLLAACDDPADAVAAGELCLPATDSCADVLHLQRPAPGRNSLEIRAINEGKDSTFHLLITTPERFELPWETRLTDQNELILVDQTYSLGSGEVLREVFGSRELTIAKNLDITASCASSSCQIEFDYLFFLEPVECYDDSSCSRGGFCELSLGVCSECSADSHCSSQQTCDIRRGTCFPQSSQGCASSPSDTPPIAFTVLFILPIILLRRRSSSKFAALALVSLLSLFFSSPAHADPPTIAFSAGGGVRFLTAEPGRLTRPGWGASVQHQVRIGRFGGAARLATHSFSLHDKTIPNELRLTGYSLTIGPRTFLSIPLTLPYARGQFPFDLSLGIDYMRWLVSQNRIAHATGLDLSYHSVGPTLGVLWRWGGVQLLAQANFSTIFGWPGGVFTLDLAIGLEN